MICTISTNSLGDQMAIAQAVVEAQVKRFLPAELGFDTSSDDIMKICPCMFLKKDVIKFLKEHEDTTTWTGVFTGLWIDFVSIYLLGLSDALSHEIAECSFCPACLLS